METEQIRHFSFLQIYWVLFCFFFLRFRFPRNPARQHHIYIYLPSLINRETNPFVQKQKGVYTQAHRHAHKSLIAFFFFFFFSLSYFCFFDLGTLLRQWLLAPTGNGEKKKKKQQIYAQTLPASQQQQSNARCYFLHPNQSAVCFLFHFPNSFFFFFHVLCLLSRCPFHFYFSFHTSKQYVGPMSSAQVVRPGIQPIDMPFIKYLSFACFFQRDPTRKTTNHRSIATYDDDVVSIDLGTRIV